MPFSPIDRDNPTNTQVPASAPSTSPSGSTYQTTMTLSGFALAILFTIVILTYIGYQGRKKRKQHERTFRSEVPLRNRNIEFDLELNILINGYGPASSAVLSPFRQSSNHRGRNQSGGIYLSAPAAPGRRGERSRGCYALPPYSPPRAGRLKILELPVERVDEAGRAPGQTSGLIRASMDLRDLRFYQEGSSATLPKYEPLPPAYFKD